MIHAVLDGTGFDQVIYGGHSVGTTSFFVMTNKRPELQEKVALANLLAPVAFVDHMTSPLHYIAPWPLLDRLM